VAAGLGLALLVALRLRAGHAAAFGHARTAIVSLNPCSDAILAEVADPGQVLALSHYSRDPRSSSMDVGWPGASATRGTVEEVLALHPDLVLGDTFLGPARARPMIASAFPSASHCHDRGRQPRAGPPHCRAGGASGRGERLVARIDAALAAAAPPPGGARAHRRLAIGRDRARRRHADRRSAAAHRLRQFSAARGCARRTCCRSNGCSPIRRA
jgi:iron complex transport system substrate-binding protein